MAGMHKTIKDNADKSYNIPSLNVFPSPNNIVYHFLRIAEKILTVKTYALIDKGASVALFQNFS